MVWMSAGDVDGGGEMGSLILGFDADVWKVVMT